MHATLAARRRHEFRSWAATPAGVRHRHGAGCQPYSSAIRSSRTSTARSIARWMPASTSSTPPRVLVHAPRVLLDARCRAVATRQSSRASSATSTCRTQKGTKGGRITSWMRHASLKRLAWTYRRLFLHRVDPCVPIEETVGRDGAAHHAGKARYIASAKRTPIPCGAHAASNRCFAATEYFAVVSRHRNDVQPASRELGVASRLRAARAGLLTGRIKTVADLPEGDRRRAIPLLRGKSRRNAELRARARGRRAANGAAPRGRHRLAARAGRDVIPIPGTNHAHNSSRTRRRSGSSCRQPISRACRRDSNRRGSGRALHAQRAEGSGAVASCEECGARRRFLSSDSDSRCGGEMHTATSNDDSDSRGACSRTRSPWELEQIRSASGRADRCAV